MADLRRHPEPEQTDRGLVKAWARNAERRVMKLESLTRALNHVRSSRDMTHQIRLVRSAGCAEVGSELGSAVIRYNRLMISFETTFMAKQRRCQAELTRMKSRLTPRVLLNQARLEWQLITQDRTGAPGGPEADFIRHTELYWLAEALMELLSLLHPEPHLPAVSQWLQVRIEELRQSQLRLMLEIEPGESPA